MSADQWAIVVNSVAILALALWLALHSTRNH